MPRLIGIDPGLVHTGVVVIDVHTDDVTVTPYVVDSVNHDAVADIVHDNYIEDTHVFIEKYRDRGTAFGTHAPLRAMEAYLVKALPTSTRIIDNTGSKQVINDDLLRLLQLYRYSQVTNHQDLRAAARIALFGAVKDERLNAILAKIVTQKLKIGEPHESSDRDPQ